jgi:hypothetical protein
MTEFLPNPDVIVISGIVMLAMILPLLIRALGRLVRTKAGHLRLISDSHS